MTDLARCAREQAALGEQIREGQEQFGLRLGVQDWLREEAFMRMPREIEMPKGDSNQPPAGRRRQSVAPVKVEAVKISPASAARIRKKAERIMGAY